VLIKVFEIRIESVFAEDKCQIFVGLNLLRDSSSNHREAKIGCLVKMKLNSFLLVDGGGNSEQVFQCLSYFG
jgi:hypothetical protein